MNDFPDNTINELIRHVRYQKLDNMEQKPEKIYKR